MNDPAPAQDILKAIHEELFDEYISDWWMTPAERCALVALLSKLRPECAIELGTLHGGSLSAISRFSKKVYSLDIDPTCRERLGARFPNVEFITGPSAETLPALLRKLQASEAKLEFVLVDAAHEREPVRQDIDNLLRFRPTCPLHVLMHDSFNPGCRQGILDAGWQANPHVRFVELDFVGGVFSDSGNYGEMWCGLALALLLPERRAGGLTVHAKNDLLFQAVRARSVHRYSRWDRRRFVAGLRRKISGFDERYLGGKLQRFKR